MPENVLEIRVYPKLGDHPSLREAITSAQPNATKVVTSERETFCYDEDRQAWYTLVSPDTLLADQDMPERITWKPDYELIIRRSIAGRPRPVNRAMSARVVTIEHWNGGPVFDLYVQSSAWTHAFQYYMEFRRPR